MTFDQAFERLIGHEGGYVNDPRDPGGETKYGIAKRQYPTVDVKNLTLAQAKEIYRRDYWNRLSADTLPVEVRFDLFDFAVNSGPGTAVRLLQRACGAREDGVLGPDTLAAIGRLGGVRTAARFAGHRLQFLTDLTTWPTFGRGWARRVASNLTGV